MIPDVIAGIGLFVLFLLLSYAAMKTSLKIAYKDKDRFDDDIQKELTDTDYAITRRDKILLVVGSLATVATLFLKPVYPSEIGYCAIAQALLVTAIVDLKVRYAPDAFHFFFLAVALADILFFDVPWSSAAIGMIFPGGVFLLVCAFYPEFMGGADIKMLITLGACLGMLQTTSLYLASCVIVCLIYAPMWLRNKAAKKEKRIFVPAVLGFYIAYMLVQYEPQALQLFDV